VVLLASCVVVSNPVEAPLDHPKEKYAWEEDQNECRALSRRTQEQPWERN
jgi:hypothetical protein